MTAPVAAAPRTLVARCAEMSDGAPGALLGEVLDRALGTLPQDVRAGACLLLAADEHCVDVATAFVHRALDTSRRLRPSDSLRLETSELLRPLAGTLPTAGPVYVLTSPDRAPGQAEQLARAFVTGGAHRAAVAAVLRRLPDGDPGHRVTATVHADGGGTP